MQNTFFNSYMEQLGLSYRARKALINFGFNSTKEVIDFVNENGMAALRNAKAGFGKTVCDEIAGLPFVIQTFEEAKKVVPLARSLQSEIERYDLIFDGLRQVYPDFDRQVESLKETDQYKKLVLRSII